jgi:hypothetical protein
MLGCRLDYFDPVIGPKADLGLNVVFVEVVMVDAPILECVDLLGDDLFSNR